MGMCYNPALVRDWPLGSPAFVKRVYSNWIYNPETAKLGYDHCDLDLWPMTFCMDISSVIGNNSWKFRDDTMTRT